MTGVVWGIMLVLIGIIFFIVALAQSAQNRSYASCSERVSATVTNKTSRRTKHGRAYELYVTYNVDGADYERWIGVNADTYDAVNEGGQYEIYYKPQNPKCAVNPENLNPKNVRVIFIVAATATVLGIVLFLIGRIV